ncbi:cytochrome P450 [Massariosphaeria phaeospora]|uniref:Cytochrome P450 n=1 Tax=Massariosphaeria phaeospora TaxID=100035 RepID=A0A7C8I0M0_9PLEO|nr:cytochrome P450 [Massariosphaeria phaeospora]
MLETNKNRTNGGNQRPVRLDLITEPVYLVQGKRHISSLWKVSAKSRSLALHNMLFTNWFGMSAKTTSKYMEDDSGYGRKSHPSSIVKPQNRMDRLSHAVFKDVLSGPDSAGVCSRFTAGLCERLVSLDISDNWRHMRDFEAFIELHMTPPNTESLWGAHLTRDSSFNKDFWGFNNSLHYFSMRLPRWLIPQTYARRDRMLKAFRQWQFHGRKNNVAPWEEDEYNPQYWGSRLIRKWQKEFLRMDDANENDLASVHLTFSWAANTNVVPSAFWAVLDIFRRPQLLAQLRQRLPVVHSTAELLELFSIAEKKARICADPLLQSIYAETLRLRVHAYALRRFLHDHVDLDGWTIPQDRLCLVSSHPAHMHGAEWNTAEGKHPLSEFWPYRFLVQSRDSAEPCSAPSEATGDDMYDGSSWTFSMQGLDGLWIPFGGGPRACPGRHLAKHHMLITMAAMVMLFDVDAQVDEKALRMNELTYGQGTLHPVGKVPFRIRRRV